MKRLEVSGAVRPLQWSLGVKGLKVRETGKLDVDGTKYLELILTDRM